MKFTFTNANGQQLAGRLEMPVGARPKAAALFAHCFTCSKDALAATRVSRALTESGLAVLRFDFTGLGHSQGDFANTNFSSNVEDLLAAAAALQKKGLAPQLLIGHSLGGAAVLKAAPQVKSCRGVVTIGAPAEPAHVSHLFGDSLDEIKTGEAEVQLGGRRFTIKRQFLEDLNEQALDLKNLGKALLIFHSPVDAIVDVDNARKLYQAARHPKSFISLDQADHLLTNRADASYVANTISAWASRYLLEEKHETELEAGEVRVRSTGASFTQVVETATHRWLADEPAKVGGDDRGPSPYDLLLAALGTCTSMTLQMYARRKQIPLDSVSVKLRHERVHAQDCEECENESGRLDVLRREITIGGELEDSVRARMLEIADRCPVHRTLHGPLEVLTRESSPAAGSTRP